MTDNDDPVEQAIAGTGSPAGQEYELVEEVRRLRARIAELEAELREKRPPTLSPDERAKRRQHDRWWVEPDD